jgi:hypothetical protein
MGRKVISGNRLGRFSEVKVCLLVVLPRPSRTRCQHCSRIKRFLFLYVGFEVATEMAQDPKLPAGSVVACDLSSSSAIKIVALLDKVLDMQAVAAAQSDEQKRNLAL